MHEAHAVDTEARNVVVLCEVLALEFEVIFFLPVTANCQNFLGAALIRNHVWATNTIWVFVTRQVVVHVDFSELIAVVILGNGKALLLGFLLLDVGADVDRIAQLNVTVEPSYLQLAYIVLGLAHQVSDTLGCLDV